MSDQKTQSGDEYRYPNEEYVVEPKKEQEQEPVMPEVPVWKQFIVVNKRKLLVAVLVIAALVAFQVMRYERDNKTVTQAPQAALVQPQKLTSFQAPTQDQALIKRSLEDIQQSGDSNSQEIVNLRNQLDSVRDQLQQMDTTNNQLKQAMLLLLQELHSVHETMNASAGNKKAGLPKPELVYAVRAIVDGRAWIEGSNGLAESVTIGDPIPGYGIVTGIYAVRGVITTNSGKEIQLGKNDF